jgi:hypothetical protein
MNKRILKRWKRENRKNKGANTEAKRLARNAEIRRAVAYPLPHDPMIQDLMARVK